MSSIFKKHACEIEWAGRKLIIETGKIARQSDSSVLARYGDTVVLATVCSEKKSDPETDFFPLTVNYQEKTFAVGRIPGGFQKREGKPADHETLTSRLIDRPIRPLFPENFFKEVQIICTVLSFDQENDTEIVSLIAASAALSISGLPFMGPLGAVRVGYDGKNFILNPKISEDSYLNLVAAGTKDGILMVESEANELPEDIMLKAVVFGHKEMQPVIELIENLAKSVKKPVEQIEEEPLLRELFQKMRVQYEAMIKQAYTISEKKERYKALAEVLEKAIDAFLEKYDIFYIKRAFEQLKAVVIRAQVLKEKKRLDGRALDVVRPIECEVNVLPCVHGSALFTRGETQALVVVTLGTSHDEQLVDMLTGEFKERFLLHYNFNPYSVGEVGRLGSPGRREIGHGRLAWRAISPLLPDRKDFAYTIRAVSEITESNGSSSMATVCGTSLAMMDAGVPLHNPIAGIAMGLIKEGDNYVVLTDILGDEDHLGDMDFKVAGTKDGITALQMDLKIASITPEIMEKALTQAKEGRIHILNEMAKTIEKPRGSVSKNAPQMATLKITRERIRDLIGPGGKVIRELCDKHQVKIDVDESGTVLVSALSEDKLVKAVQEIESIAKDPEVGDVFAGVVVKVMEFGAFVRFMGEKEGLVHVSEMAGFRIEHVSDYLRAGDKVSVKYMGFDDRGKVRLTMKGLNDALFKKKKHH